MLDWKTESARPNLASELFLESDFFFGEICGSSAQMDMLPKELPKHPSTSNEAGQWQKAEKFCKLANKQQNDLHRTWTVPCMLHHSSAKGERRGVSRRGKPPDLLLHTQENKNKKRFLHTQQEKATRNRFRGLRR